MKPHCLASSSAGNCYIFDFTIKGSHNLIMVECGIPMPDIYRKCNQLGINIADVKACLITHAHSDHCKSAKAVERLGVPIYASLPTLKAIKTKGHVLKHEEWTEVLQGLYCFPFEVEHDIDGAFGFVLRTPEDTVIFVNDSKTWKTNLINFKPDYVFIECNYDQHKVYAQYYDLRDKLKSHQDEYGSDELHEMETKYKQHERNINAHMSLAGTIRNLGTLNLNRCRAIFLMHLSDRYANEYRMKNDIQAVYGVLTLVCGKKGGIK